MAKMSKLEQAIQEQVKEQMSDILSDLQTLRLTSEERDYLKLCFRQAFIAGVDFQLRPQK